MRAMWLVWWLWIPVGEAAEPAAPTSPSPREAPGPESGVPGAARTVERKGGGAGQARRGVPVSGAASDDLWFAAAVAGAVCLLGVLYAWFRGRRRPLRLPDGVRLLAEAGLFGPGTPGLGLGVTQWVVVAADRAKLVDHLVAEIGTLRPVFLLAEDSLRVSPCRVGPVFRASFDKAAAFHDAAYDLQDVHPSIALVLGFPASRGAAAEWAREVNTDFPVLAVVERSEEGAGPAVHCTLVGSEWSFAAEPVSG